MMFRQFFVSAALAFGLASGLAGCGSESGFGPEGIPPLPGEDATLPDTPRNSFDSCYPPDQGLAILLDGRGASFGSPASAPVDGGSVVAIDRESLCFGDEGCAEGGTGTGGDTDAGTSPGTRPFRAIGRWASAPLEFFEQDPGSAGYGLMAQRTAARGNGDPLSSLRRSGMAGSWGDQYPDYAASLGSVWVIDGEFDPDDCHLWVRLRGAVRTADGGMSDPMDEAAAAPIYAPRSDGRTHVASANLGNERLVVLTGPIEADLEYPTEENTEGDLIGPPSTVCVGGCATEPGGTLESLEARLVVKPFNEDAGSGVEGGEETDGGADAGTDTGGIPPLPGEDAGG